ncbi:diguanylate cyclase domain-containing protein [Paenisporosarcina sp.]|uniref:diguanylate cyclase domain-containing protein n=1 Tax=Paenisporosarcina sp. TaxID=1932001 RepID=UPI003C77605B
MKQIFDYKAGSLFLIVILMIGVQIPITYLMKEGITGLPLIAILLLLISISLVAGPVTGLFGALMFIFIVGTALLYMSVTNTVLTFDLINLPIPLYFGFGLALIILILIAGRIHDSILDQLKKNRFLQEEIRQYVAVDSETGFDNRHRMVTEIQTEMSRVNRYDGAFTLILLKMDHFDDFKRLYGEKETTHLLASLAGAMQKTIRKTDRKFRYGMDRFALLLTNTDDRSVEIVYDKLAEKIKTHQLLNEKYVTLTFRSGHVVYDQHASIEDYQELFEQIESEMVFREL